MLITYTPKNFQAKSLRLIETANDIIDEYSASGDDLTLRQLYYQFVARGIIENTERSYKNLGSVINDARLAGLIDWDKLEDRTRNLEGYNHYDDPASFLRQMVRAYSENTRAGQSTHLEVWVEKEALIGVVKRVCNEYDVDFFACRGYVSQSEQHAAAMRLKDILEDDEDVTNCVVLHLGDHDPSGIDMTRDIEDRMKLFLGYYGFEEGFSIQRLALNMDQIRAYKPPPNPAKLTDSRAADYIQNFGNSSWELDALSPKIIRKLVEDAILEHTDKPMFDECVRVEKVGRDKLLDAAARFEQDEED